MRLLAQAEPVACVSGHTHPLRIAFLASANTA
jgi:hypothetical protein